jgi:hypothetical protein
VGIDGHHRVRDAWDESGLSPTPEKLRQRSELVFRAKAQPDYVARQVSVHTFILSRSSTAYGLSGQLGNDK